MIHLMPYAELDLDYDKKHNSAWVTLPNTYYDPKNGPALYNRYIDELVYADELGFDGICCNEHHQNAYGLMPIPGVIAGALARQTKNCKIAVLGRALPLLTYPLAVAEEYAMLDNISNGRLIAGFVRGIGAEYHSTGVNPAESHDRFHEAHDLILQAWTKPGPSRLRRQVLSLRICEHLAAHGAAAASADLDSLAGLQRDDQLGLAPDRANTPICRPSVRSSSCAVSWGSIAQQAEKYGYEAKAQQLGWATPIYVSDTDESAMREARPHIEAFYNKFLRMPFEMLLPPGYLSLNSMASVGEKARVGGAAQGSEKKIEDLAKLGMIICGSPDSVAQQLEHHQKEIGYGKVIAMMQFGTLPHDMTKRSMELFASKVMPKLRHIGEEEATPVVQAAE